MFVTVKYYGERRHTSGAKRIATPQTSRAGAGPMRHAAVAGYDDLKRASRRTDWRR